MTSRTTSALAPVPAASTLLATPAMTPSLSTVSSSSNISASSEPSMWSAASSRRSSASSHTSGHLAGSASADNLAKSALPPQQQQKPSPQPQSHSSSGGQKIDPLSRTYPKPEQEINVSEALRREPLKWTLGYWTKNARTLSPSPLASAPSSAELLEKKKNELRQAQRDLDQAARRRR